MYEKHEIYDKLVPFIFHKDVITKDFKDISNWHKNIEILYVIEGEGEVVCDMNVYHVSVGDIFVINSNNIHNVNSDNILRYYRLIIDNKFCEENGIYCSELQFRHKISDETIKKMYDNVVQAFKTRTEFYKTSLRVRVLDLLVAIAEKYIEYSADETHTTQTEAARRALEYIDKNFSEDISIDDLSEFVGYSKAYLSRQFKKVTSMSIVEYINYVRCMNANSKLSSGDMSVGEVALECGFKNFSYFSKTYKKIICRLPSEDSK